MLIHYDEFKKSFKVLGLSETADLGMIKRKFKTLAKRHHPDLGAQSHEEFCRINRAYRLLIQMRSAFKENE